MLPDATRRQAADLLNFLDLLSRRKLPNLGEPWQLNLRQLWQWRERLIDIVETLERANEISAKLLLTPYALCGLETPSFAIPEVEEGEETPELPAVTPFNESLMDYALSEYLSVEEEALESDAIEREALDHQARLDDCNALIAGFRHHGREVPQNLLDELAMLLEIDAEGAQSEGEEAALEEAGESPVDEGEVADETLTLEERQDIFREGHQEALALMKLAISNLGLWVREASAQFRPAE